MIDTSTHVRVGHRVPEGLAIGPRLAREEIRGHGVDEARVAGDVALRDARRCRQTCRQRIREIRKR